MRLIDVRIAANGIRPQHELGRDSLRELRVAIVEQVRHGRVDTGERHYQDELFVFGEFVEVVGEHGMCPRAEM